EGRLSISGDSCPVELGYETSWDLERANDKLQYHAVRGESPLHALSEFSISKKAIHYVAGGLEDSHAGALTESQLKLKSETQTIQYVVKERVKNGLVDSDYNLTVQFPDF